MVETHLDWFEIGAGVVREEVWIDVDVWDWSSQSYKDFEYTKAMANLLDLHDSVQEDGIKSAPSEYFRIKVCEGEYYWLPIESKNETASRTTGFWVEWCMTRYVKLFYLKILMK